jgi:hypothetical protein
MSEGDASDNKRLKTIIKEVDNILPIMNEFSVLNLILKLSDVVQMRRDAEALFVEMQKAVTEVSHALHYSLGYILYCFPFLPQ